jgi:hypothetical protein
LESIKKMVKRVYTFGFIILLAIASLVVVSAWSIKLGGITGMVSENSTTSYENDYKSTVYENNYKSTGYGNEYISTGYGTNGILLCNETDAGYDIYNKGWIIAANILTPTEDRCRGSYLYEYYCRDKNYASVNITNCTSGCSNGACVKSTNLTNITKCYDSDGGLNYGSTGFVSINGTVVERDKCGYSSLINYAYDVFCLPSLSDIGVGGRVGYSVMSTLCPNGCNNGKCVGWDGGIIVPDSTCLDLDNGTNFFERSKAYDFTKGGVYEDYCSKAPGSKTIVEYICRNGRVDFDLALCPNGCRDGACLPPPGVDCKDSDNGLNYTTYGSVSRNGMISYDRCLSETYLSELSCNLSLINSVSLEDPLVVTSYYCPNGCMNGACLSEPFVQGTCSELSSEIVNKKELNIWDIDFMPLNYDYEGVRSGVMYYWNEKERKEDNYTYKEYEESYSTSKRYDDGKYEIIYVSLVVFDDPTVNVQEILDRNLKHSICRVERHYSEEGESDRAYYVCNYNVMVNDYYSNSRNEVEYRNIFWSKDNAIVNVRSTIYSYVDDEELQQETAARTFDLISSLRDNRYKGVYEDFDLTIAIQAYVYHALEMCSSDLALPTIPGTNEPCYNNWQCKLEPVVCPEYGYQNRICNDMGSCGMPAKQDTIYCSPGICSGCYVPRWFGYNADNICVPYGARLASQEKDSGREYEFVDEDEASLVVYPKEDYAVLTIIGAFYNDTYNLYSGNTYFINVGGDEIKFTVDKIGSDDRGNYIEISTVENFNAYCGYDGRLGRQKVGTLNYPASCQENFECDSNLCTSGYCVELDQIAREAQGFRAMFVKMYCRLGNLFSDNGYNQCVADYFGPSDVPSSGSGGSSGGSN